MKPDQSKTGQALVLIVLAIVGLLGITALSIDGGNAFADRRKAQSAADNAALTAALTKLQNLTSNATCDNNCVDKLLQAACNITSSNGYSDPDCTVVDLGPNGDVPEVTVQYKPQLTGCGDSNSPYANNPDYVQVVIHSQVHTYFGTIIGIPVMYNCVEAIAHAKIPTWQSYANGNAIAGMDCHGKWTVDLTGNSHSALYNGGIFSNSDDPHAMLLHANSDIYIQPPWIASAVGGIDYNGTGVTTASGYPQIPCDDPYNMPPDQYPTDYPPANYHCDVIVDKFPDDIKSSIYNNTTHEYHLDSGLTYCITGSFNYTNHDPFYGENVHIVLEDCIGKNESCMTLNGGSEMVFTALGVSPVPHGYDPDADPLNKILFYVPKPNFGQITINGSDGSSFRGTIFAPNSDVKLNGNYEGVDMQSQIIGATVDVSGTSDLTVNFNPNDNHKYLSKASVELTK